MNETLLELARPAIRQMLAYVSARSLVTEGEIFLDANESPWSPESVGPEHAGINRYPEPQPRRLRAVLASLYGVAEERVFLGRGTDEAIDTLVRTFCEAGQDRVLFCPPTYGMYEVAANIQGAGCVRVPLQGEAFTVDVGNVIKGIEAGVKLVFLCSPNNPVGNTVAPEIIREIARAARGRALVVLDEAYLELSEAKSFAEQLDEFPNLIVLRTLSKAWALAGARCGVALGDPTVISLLQKVRAPYPLSLPAVEVVMRALSREGQLAAETRIVKLKRAREALGRALSESPRVLRVYPSEANFVLVKTDDSPVFSRLCRAAGVIVRDRGKEPGLENCVRISVGTDAENTRLLEAIGGGRL